MRGASSLKSPSAEMKSASTRPATIGAERGVEIVSMARPDVLHLEPKCPVGVCGYA